MAKTNNNNQDWNKFIIYPKGSCGDKNNNVQIELGNIIIAKRICCEVHQELGTKFHKLNLFLQGKTLNKDRQWVMIESWSEDADLFFEFCEYLAEKYSKKLDFCS